MREFTSEKELHRLVREMAKKTRQEILEFGVEFHDFEKIASKYGIKFSWQEMPFDMDGHYIKSARTITLNNKITNNERRNFSFFHELFHDRIDNNNNFWLMFRKSDNERGWR